MKPVKALVLGRPVFTNDWLKPPLLNFQMVALPAFVQAMSW